MTTLSILINLDNDAFVDHESIEIRSILRKYTTTIGDGLLPDRVVLRDSNGNTVGVAVRDEGK